MNVARRWGPSVAVHLILGMVALVPLWLSMMLAADVLRAEPEGSSSDPAVTGSAPAWTPILVALWAVFLALWLPVGSRARPSVPGVSGRRYWAVGAALVLTPMVFSTALLVLVEG
ncbi:hypothetical protein [Streptomyces griseoflavus]|uniref:hypothetical protein n=1 Tax=Streptomyces griseoflavus TaxID=35619 RepID=UPI00167EB3BC|nr:hypothetical protein [Streptomyces griseoflavus]GGV11607.1 hypothetical protein GCM10010293_01900 [Streptomyces griseoflavus]